jgi:hypothetical protein
VVLAISTLGCCLNHIFDTVVWYINIDRVITTSSVGFEPKDIKILDGKMINWDRSGTIES